MLLAWSSCGDLGIPVEGFLRGANVASPIIVTPNCSLFPGDFPVVPADPPHAHLREMELHLATIDGQSADAFADRDRHKKYRLIKRITVWR